MRLLLVAWWCATVVPGVAVALVIPDDAESGLGAAVGVWIVGYIVQLFLFMAVSKQVKGVGTMISIWFVVSLLPFAIDWTAPVSWWGAIAFVLLAVVIALFIDYDLTRHSLLQHNGIRATAVVLEVKKPLMNVVVNNVYIKRRLRVRIDRDDQAPPYETTYSDLWEMGTVPDPGDSFRVVVDPQRPRHLDVLDSSADSGGSAGPASSTPARSPVSGGQKTWRFTSWRGPAGSKPARSTPTVPAPAPPQPGTYAPYQPEPDPVAGSPVRDVVTAIRELAQLHESGQLTDDEFAQAKRELLGGEDSAAPE
jgi:hypothetical protein